MRIAVSGHRGLDETTTGLVESEIRNHLQQLRAVGGLVGISCLADGADQVFARAVLGAGGTLIAVIPAEQYRAGLPERAHAEYDELLARAAEVYRLPYIESTPQAHMAASRRMLEDADALVAVWDGRPARGYGGTADVVDLARTHDLDITLIWPAGATR